MTAVTTVATLYDTDYLQWWEVTIAQLQRHDYTQVDWEHLLEELEEMPKRERRSLRSNLVILLLHLLKWQYQPERRSNSWKGSIVEHRRRIRELLEESPSLQPYLQMVFDRCYADAIEQAIAETGLAVDVFPATCPYPPTDLLASGFLPPSCDASE